MEERDLVALEDELRRLLAAEPAPLLRNRVARRVARELRLERRRGWLAYVAGMAALVVLWINLSWSTSRDTAVDWRAGEPAVISAEMIEHLVPGMSRREALRQALILTGGQVDLAPSNNAVRIPARVK